MKFFFSVLLGLLALNPGFCQDSMIAQVESPSLEERYPKHLGGLMDIPYNTDVKDWYSLKMGEVIYGISKEERCRKREIIDQKTKEVFFNLYNEKADRIPHLTHRVWITGAKNPAEPSSQDLENYVNSLKMFKSNDWKHHFWCMEKSDLPQTVEILEGAQIPIEIHELKEIYSSMKAKHIFDAYYQDDQYCFASDIARQNIIYLYGGIYSDLGTIFLEDLTSFADSYDYMFTNDRAYIDQSFFGYKKNDPIFKSYLETLDTLYKLPQELKDITKHPTQKQGWHSVAHLMACIDCLSKPDDRFLMVASGAKSLMLLQHRKSWMGQGKSGNKVVNESRLDILSVVPLEE